MSPVSDQMRTVIKARIDELAAEEGVLILFAIESGSRAWGFHSTDSDYDVRFVYARPVDWHLSMQDRRDVIERPISDDSVEKQRVASAEKCDMNRARAPF